MVLGPIELLRYLLDLASITTADASPEWAEALADVGACEPGDERECARLESPPPAFVPEVIDVEDLAREARYGDKKNAAGEVIRRGAVKRTKYKLVTPNELRQRRIVIVVHQAGVVRAPGRERAHKITCQRAIGADGRRYRVHPIGVRLDAADRFNRSPWHALNIEVVTNAEGQDGTGDWWRPGVFGRGRATDLALLGLAHEIKTLVGEVEEIGARVEAVVPHRVSGSNKGKPTRPICCGSRIYSAAEEVAIELGLSVAAPGWCLPGALPVPDAWRCARFGSGGGVRLLRG